ncbi:MAG: hypothetical protein KC468_25950, partial [Myxococcales bacterium]|nr:hypothetical protein [Myxococcales bacterium]
MRSLTRGSLDEVRSWIKDAGLTSLTVNLGWQRKPGGDKATEKFVSKAQGDRVRALRQDGIKIDAWAWVRPGAASELNEWIREARDLWGGLDAVCLNAEAPWYPSSNLVRAGFVQAAREYV